MLRAVLIDDEEVGRETLVGLIRMHCSDTVRVIGEAGNVSDGYKIISELQPDIVFLDIEMYGENGFDLLDKFDELEFNVIFTTAYSNYSIKAIRYSALDYLLKPVPGESLKLAVDRAKKKKDNQEIKTQYEILQRNLRMKDACTRIVIPDMKGLTVVEVSEIIRCESKNNYTIIYLSNGEHIFSSRTLKEYEDILRGPQFFRVHNCHLINLSFVKRYEKREGGALILKDNSEIEVSRRRKQELLEKLTAAF